MHNQAKAKPGGHKRLYMGVGALLALSLGGYFAGTLAYPDLLNVITTLVLGLFL